MCHLFCCCVIQGVSFNYHHRMWGLGLELPGLGLGLGSYDKVSVSVSSRNLSQVSVSVSVSEVTVSTTSLVHSASTYCLHNAGWWKQKRTFCNSVGGRTTGLQTRASERFFPGEATRGFSRGGPKVVKFVFNHLKLGNILFLLKISKSRVSTPPFPPFRRPWLQTHT